MASGQFNIREVEVIQGTSTSTSVPQRIIDDWNKFPQGRPFIVDYYNGLHSTVAGYIYAGGAYGGVLVWSYSSSLGTYLVQKSVNTFTKSEIQVTPV